MALMNSETQPSLHVSVFFLWGSGNKTKTSRLSTIRLQKWIALSEWLSWLNDVQNSWVCGRQHHPSGRRATSCWESMEWMDCLPEIWVNVPCSIDLRHHVCVWNTWTDVKLLPLYTWFSNFQFQTWKGTSTVSHLVSNFCFKLARGHGIQSGTTSNEATWLYGIQSLISSTYLFFKSIFCIFSSEIWHPVKPRTGKSFLLMSFSPTFRTLRCNFMSIFWPGVLFCICMRDTQIHSTSTSRKAVPSKCVTHVGSTRWHELLRGIPF